MVYAILHSEAQERTEDERTEDYYLRSNLLRFRVTGKDIKKLNVSVNSVSLWLILAVG